MAQRGRKSMAALAVVDSGPPAALEPVMPPPGLTAAEREVWRGLVDSKPAGWFGTEHIPLMVDYVRQVCRGHVIDAQIKAFDPESLGTDEGLRRYEKLIVLATRISGIQVTQLRSMRITQQAVYRKEKVWPGKGRKLWQCDPS